MTCRLSSNGLKLIALLSMLIDHIGAVLFPSVFVFRIVGRLAFPVFVFMLNEGFFYTKSRRNYLLRLVVFAFISEVPFDLALHDKVMYHGKCNVFFTLALGMILMIAADKLYEDPPAVLSEIIRSVPIVLIILACFYTADMIHTDYGSLGVMSIGTGYILKKLDFHRCMVFAGITASLALVKPIEAIAFFALPFVFLYNGSHGAKSPVIRVFFYCFYPVHLLLLYIISQYI